jgi:hypothetical protein
VFWNHFNALIWLHNIPTLNILVVCRYFDQFRSLLQVQVISANSSRVVVTVTAWRVAAAAGRINKTSSAGDHRSVAEVQANSTASKSTFCQTFALVVVGLIAGMTL